MKGVIDANVRLDYIEFLIFPSQNRFEACACLGDNTETVTCGPLDTLLLHCPKIKALFSEGSASKYNLIAPEALDDARWFTKSTVLRFLDVIGSSETQHATSTLRNEISQLEEARRFHLSLYAKGPQNSFEDADSNTSADSSVQKVGINSVSSDDSKNELLRAMDLRLTALRCDLAAAFAQAASNICSTEEINDIEKFSSHFGATDLRDSLCKLVEVTQKICTVDIPCNKQSSSQNDKGNGRVSKMENNTQIHQPSNSDIPVKYGCSPAKAAQFERQSSSESGESSYSSEEEEPSMERSRTVIRSASPRRSASPMRRVQIGRSGPRRSTPLTIKSLNYFPRERVVSHKDTASSDEETSEQPSRRSEGHVRRMSVQDAINLFESKQRDQITDIQKTRSLLNTSVTANKSVLRRWSTGTGESSIECPQAVASDSSFALTPNNLESGEITNGSPECGLSPRCHLGLPDEIDVKPDSPEQSASTLVCPLENAIPTQAVSMSGKVTSSADWSQQREAELNQLLMKMMETKPVKYRSAAPDNIEGQNLASEQRGGFHEHYKEKRNEKLQEGTAAKHTEKQKKMREMQQILDERKAEMVSANANDGRKPNVKTQKSQKTFHQSANTRKDTSKPSAVKRASTKTSPMPATRKSWPSTPSPRPTGTLPAKNPPRLTSAATTPTHRKSQPAPSASRSNQELKKTQLQPKAAKSTQSDKIKVVKEVSEKKQQLSKKAAKPTKTKVQTVAADSTSLGKPSFYSKVTKKSSIVPLEPKPFLRKGSGISSGVSPVSRTKVSSQPSEPSRTSNDLIQAEKNEIVSSSCDPVVQQQEVDLEPVKNQVNLESEIEKKNQEKSADVDSPNQVTLGEDCSSQKIADSALNTEAADESNIPPTAWVEIEEHEDQAVSYDGGIYQVESSPTVAPVGMPGSRVRHSLSQMLLEESSEPDVIEWGNAENPPTMIFQKDSPKGLRRLLKFARKSKTEANSTGWSSPSVFSEGEDDAEKSKSTSKRNTENLLKKATIHGKNYGQQKTSSHEKNLAAHGFLAQANISKSVAQSLCENLQNDPISTSVATTKATRSFFSLSAFKGSKQNETKFR